MCSPRAPTAPRASFRSSRVAHTRHAACASNTFVPNLLCVTHTPRALEPSPLDVPPVRTPRARARHAHLLRVSLPHQEPEEHHQTRREAEARGERTVRVRGSQQRRAPGQTGRGAPHIARAESAPACRQVHQAELQVRHSILGRRLQRRHIQGKELLPARAGLVTLQNHVLPHEQSEVLGAVRRLSGQELRGSWGASGCCCGCCCG